VSGKGDDRLMPDVYTRVTQAPSQILEGLMGALELRAADPQLRAMLTTYLTDAALPRGAHVLEVGCGTGAVTRIAATWPGVAAAVGVDPSPVFIAKARELARDLPSVTFETADGQSLPPEPAVLMHEAVRVLRPGGCVAVFEGDYASIGSGVVGGRRARPIRSRSVNSGLYRDYALSPGGTSV
jgi:SAM-dependent methyltransferase